MTDNVIHIWDGYEDTNGRPCACHGVVQPPPPPPPRITEEETAR